MTNKVIRIALPALVLFLGIWLLGRQASLQPESASRQEALRQALAPGGSERGEETAVSSPTGIASTMDPVTPAVVDMSQVRIDTTDRNSQYNRWLRGEIDLDENENLLSEAEMARRRAEARAMPPSPGLQTAVSPAAQAPLPADASFESINFEETELGGAVPPDPELAVGLNHLIAVVNRHVEIYDKNGASVLGPTAAKNLFSQSPCTGGLYDPNVLYDEEAERWFLAYDQGAFSSSGGYCVLASQSDDPLGLWNEYFFGFNSSSAWLDFPHAGVGDEYVVMGGNLFSLAGNFVESRVYALDKNAMYAGDPVTPVVKGLGDLGVFTPQPLNLHGATAATWPDYGDVHYILSDDFNGSTYPLLRWDISDNTLTTVSVVDLGGGGYPLPAPQNGGGDLQTNDYRLLDFEYRNGYGWTAMTVSCNPGGGTVNCVRWAQIDLAAGTLGPAGSGTYGTDGEHRFFPDVAADRCGNMAIGYTKSSQSTYPGIWYAGRQKSDSAGTLGAEAELKTGEVTYQAYDGAAYRWGDYTGMTIDPDGQIFWYLGEYSRNSGGAGARWGTWIGSLAYDCPPTPAFTLSLSAQSQVACVEDEVSYGIGVDGHFGFQGDVSLAVPAPPDNTDVSFSQNPAPVSATVTMTLDTTGGAAGSYQFDLVGSGVQSPTLAQTRTLELDLYAAVPATPTLLSPVDGAETQSIRPWLSWGAMSNAVSYTVQIASDADFMNVVEEASLLDTSYQLSSTLSLATDYFWRVRGHNVCGQGVASPVYTFRTVQETPPDEFEQVTLFSDGFETPADGWSHGANSGSDTWTLAQTRTYGGQYAYHVEDLSSRSDQYLTSPSIDLTPPSGGTYPLLRFWNYQAFEDPAGSGGCWDGGVLEISVDGGPWNSLEGELLTDLYDGILAGGPLEGRNAWCGSPQDWTQSLVDLSDYAGEEVRFRFRISTDAEVGGEGWYIDDVTVTYYAPEQTAHLLYLPLITQPEAEPESDFATQVVELVNAERAKVGCAPLAISSQLTAAAQGHSEDMAVNDFFSHTGYDGSSPGERIKETGYQYSWAGENIAAGYSSPEAAVAGWMNSDGHRANILNCGFEEIGVGYYYLADDQGNVNYHHYWTQVFATPK